jgi:hypothetical protein
MAVTLSSQGEPVSSFNGWKGPKPTSMGELFKFYCDYVKPLYALIQSQNTMPQQVLFELNAAFDHLSRHWAYHESEADVVAKAFGHLKRACLDIFKLRLREVVDMRNDLRATDLSPIDNGAFLPAMNMAFRTIRELSKKARTAEGRPDEALGVPAFELWEEVFILCDDFEQQFYSSTHVNWATSRQTWMTLRGQWLGFVVGVGASLAAAVIWKWGGM